ncbi:MAG: prepilin peptidase [Mesotoga sp.]|uniref:prepilin peptidase n=1 Tax=Mesotoga sp. BH458_6_3_2_1 TaxID=1437446 RepID=UPI000EF1E896|nr:A24 family peptidase [Mesotoga sp. BH458_6_3_2_1]MDD2333060.1 prepilin peptidase [Mesotoga sp.]MDI9369005.1 prepilin peptidase [Thermotogota bacterium]RLL87428.1 peptidase A24 [Mesotoga sp. BH458_6_3_2_1]
MWDYLAFRVPVFFVFGLIFGSFSNALIFRIPSKEYSIVRPRRSFCPHCKHELSWKDNLPVISYLVLKGKCRYCGNPISARYPTVELLTAGLYALNASLFSLSGAISLSVLSTGLIVSSFIDLEHYMIPDLGVILVGVGAFAWSIFEDRFPLNLLYALLVTGAMVAFFLIANLVRKDSFGFGDVELLAVLSLATGVVGSLYTIMIASFAALIVYAIKAAAEGKRFDRRAQLPFGPFIAIGGYSTIIFLNFIEALYRV